MHNTFINILENYTNELHKNFKSNPLAQLIRNSAITIQTKSSLSDKYILKGSPGNGNWAEIPWIAVFDKSITDSATHGFYIVYLFQANMQGVYLSLNQGWTYYSTTYKAKQARENIFSVSESIRNYLHSTLDDFPEKEINLYSTGDLGKGYELGHICGKYYNVADIPSDSILINDLRNMLGIYRELKGLMGNLNSDNFITALLSEEKLKPRGDDDEDAFQTKVILASKSHTPKEPQPRPSTSLTSSSARPKWLRNPAHSKESIENANYQCEIESDHKTFISQTTGKNFVEAHHLIPMEFQEQFQNSLDVPGNIISLCPNCHRAFHHSNTETKIELIKTTYLKHYNDLSKFGIKISLPELLNFYSNE